LTIISCILVAYQKIQVLVSASNFEMHSYFWFLNLDHIRACKYINLK